MMVDNEVTGYEINPEFLEISCAQGKGIEYRTKRLLAPSGTVAGLIPADGIVLADAHPGNTVALWSSIPGNEYSVKSADNELVASDHRRIAARAWTVGIRFGNALTNHSSRRGMSQVCFWVGRARAAYLTNRVIELI